MESITHTQCDEKNTHKKCLSCFWFDFGGGCCCWYLFRTFLHSHFQIHGLFDTRCFRYLSFYFSFTFLFFFYSLHICWTALCWMRARVHTHTFIHKHSSYTNIFRLLLLLLLLLCCCCFVVPKLTMNVKCRNLLIFLLVCAHSLSLARSLFLYLSMNLSIPLSEQLFRIDTHFLSRSRCYGWICCRYIRLLWSQWCVLMHVSNEMLLLQ